MQTITKQPIRQFTLAFAAVCCFACCVSLHAGGITGIVPDGKKLTAASAVNRQTDKRFPGKVDAATGKFTVSGLPGDAVYDCILDFGKTRLEGVNLKVPASDYEEEQPLTDEDVATIKTKILGMNQFEDKVEVLTIQGNIQHAVILLNKRRTTPFYESKPGEIIWRPELWHFERPDETWVKVQDEMFIILYRQRIQGAEYDKKSVTFDPLLGGIAITEADENVELGKVIPPTDKPGVRLRQPADAKNEEKEGKEPIEEGQKPKSTGKKPASDSNLKPSAVKE